MNDSNTQNQKSEDSNLSKPNKCQNHDLISRQAHSKSKQNSTSAQEIVRPLYQDYVDIAKYLNIDGHYGNHRTLSRVGKVESTLENSFSNNINQIPDQAFNGHELIEARGNLQRFVQYPQDRLHLLVVNEGPELEDDDEETTLAINREQDPIIKDMLSNRSEHDHPDHEEERQKRMYNMLRHSKHYKKRQEANRTWQEQNQNDKEVDNFDVTELDEALREFEDELILPENVLRAPKQKKKRVGHFIDGESITDDENIIMNFRDIQYENSAITFYLNDRIPMVLIKISA